MKTFSLASAVIVLAMVVSSPFVWAKAVTVGIDGMTCSSCARKVEKQISALKSKGVETCKIDLKAQAANLNLSDQATVTPDDLKAAVKKAGYSVTQVTGF